jgi:DNA-binding transcriptional regulator YhcF (GntR family)
MYYEGRSMATQTARDYIAGCIREDISAGKYPLGTKTTLEELGTRYPASDGRQVSRVTMRASLHVLQEEKLVYSRQGVGVIFGPWSTLAREGAPEEELGPKLHSFISFRITGGPSMEEAFEALRTRQLCRFLLEAAIQLTSVKPRYLPEAQSFEAEGILEVVGGRNQPVTLLVATCPQVAGGMMLASNHELDKAGLQLGFPMLQLLSGEGL